MSNHFLMSGKFILIIFCFLLLSCSKNQQIEQNIIIVKVPPFYDEKLSREENYYRFQHLLFPQSEIPNPIPKGLPYDSSLIVVSVDEKGKFKFNGSEILGSVSDTHYLKWHLADIFLQREKRGVYEPRNWKIVKAVGIKTAHSVKYGDFMKVVNTIKESGADPIVLLFDDDARP